LGTWTTSEIDFKLKYFERFILKFKQIKVIIIYKNWFHWRSIFSKFQLNRIERSRLPFLKPNKSMASYWLRLYLFKKPITKERRLHKVHKMAWRNNKISSLIWNNKRPRTILIQLICPIRSHLNLIRVNRPWRTNNFNNLKYWLQIWIRQICYNCQ